MDDTLTPHEQRARRAVQHERERAHHRAAEVWLDVSRLAPNGAWRQWRYCGRISVYSARKTDVLPEKNLSPAK